MNATGEPDGARLSAGGPVRSFLKQSSGRVVSVGRVLLAATFLIALLVEPSRSGDVVLWVLGLYLLAALVVLAATWSDWWLDHRIAGPAHIADLALFALLVAATDALASPFYVLSVYLILAPALRWGWRRVFLTAAAVTLICFAAGLYAAVQAGATSNLDRVLIRTGHLLTLSMLLIWFGMSREMALRSRADASDDPTAHDSPPERRTVELAMARFPAEAAYLIWWEKEEPWVNVAASDPARTLRNLDPDSFLGGLEVDEAARPLLFDLPHGRALALDAGSNPVQSGIPDFLTAPITRSWGLRTGLAVRIRASAVSGELILCGVDGLASDDLREAERLGRELSNLFDRDAALNINAEDAVRRAKLELSRDLHDGVLQSLSGAAFRLEALRSHLNSGRPADEEIGQIQKQFAEEQRGIRAFIEQLQPTGPAGRQVDIVDRLRGVMSGIERQWHIAGRCTSAEDMLLVPASMEHPLKQIVREAVANAVRHGGAGRVDCDLSRRDDSLLVVIRDDGRGFALQGEFDERELKARGLTPWSIYERTKSLGGSVSLFSTPMGSQLRLDLPMSHAE